MKNFATSPCYHVVITYVSLGPWFYWLTLIFRSLGCFLLMNYFRVSHSDTSIHFLLLKLYSGHYLTMLQVTFRIKLVLLIFQCSFDDSVFYVCSVSLLWLKIAIRHEALTLFRMRRKGPPPPYQFSLVTSTNVGIRLQNFLFFNFNSFATLV